MKMRQDHIDKIRAGNSHTFYISWVWRQKRLSIFKRDNKECQRCKKLGRFHMAETVHHIKELRDFPKLGLDDENLISLCNVCHNIVHERFEGSRKDSYINEERW